MGKKRLYLLIIWGVLLPWFFPGARDTLSLWDRQSGATETVRGYPVTVASALSALLRMQLEQNTTAPAVSERVPSPDDRRLKNGGVTLTAEQVDAVLRAYNSPAQGTGEAFVENAERTGVDNAWVLAQFIHESGAGSNPAWAGIKPNGESTANTGNLVYAPGRDNYGRFADFNGDWEAGVAAHFDLLDAYAEGGAPSGKQHETIDSAVAEWAPASDGNNPTAYADAVMNDVRSWRQLSGATLEKVERTKRPPTDDYRVNPNARFDTVGPAWSFQPGSQHWGVDVLGVENQAVYAPFSGVFVARGSYPEGGPTAGEYVMFLDAAGNEVYFGHLKNTVLKNPGEPVTAGEKLGEIRADLAHTHIQVRGADGPLIDFEVYYANY